MTPSQVVNGNEFEAIRAFVRGELCERNELEPDAFQMSERVLTRQGKPCGFYFCVYGPRSVRLTAVWDLAKNMIWFYDSLGRRSAGHEAPEFDFA